MVCETWRVARSSVYALRAQQGGPLTSDRQAAREARREDGTERRGAGGGDPDGAEGESVPRRGPPGGEGAKGIRVGKNRVLSLMRVHGLLALVRRGIPAEIGPTVEKSGPRGRTSSGERTRRGSGRRRRPGAGSSRPLTTVLRTSSAGTLRRRATAVRRWNRSARASGPTWAASARPSPWASGNARRRGRCPWRISGMRRKRKLVPQEPHSAS